MRVLRNNAKTETVATQNDCAMEQNINFFLTTTVCVLYDTTIYGLS